MKHLEITKRQIDENIIQIFVPMKIRKRGCAAMMIVPEGQAASKKNFDEKLINAFAKAYQWKTIIDDENNNLNSISDIARNENISNSHATKIYRLNFISPKIIEAIVNGTAPRDLRLQDIFAKKAPEIWQEQEEMWLD
jgi:site-specific DNA recombinase